MSKPVKLITYTIIGAGIGYAYYYYIGCTSGSCPLTSTWYITTGYGAVMGVILALPSKA